MPHNHPRPLAACAKYTKRATPDNKRSLSIVAKSFKIREQLGKNMFDVKGCRTLLVSMVAKRVKRK